MNKIENYYIIAMEECSEIQKAISKSLRFGLDDHNPDTPLITNNDEIIEEYYQLQAVMEWLIKNGNLVDVDEKTKEKIKKEKLEKIEKYLNYSIQKGNVKE
jgi:hypothetical protein